MFVFYTIHTSTVRNLLPRSVCTACGVSFIFMDCDDLSTQYFGGASNICNGREYSEVINVFCYNCKLHRGKDTKKITDRLVILFEKCFEMEVSLLFEYCIPQCNMWILCNMFTHLEKHQYKDKLNFKTPTKWRKLLDSSYCYFFMTDMSVKTIRINNIVYGSEANIQLPVIRSIKGIEDVE